jgi:hypothetical protein
MRSETSEAAKTQADRDDDGTYVGERPSIGHAIL